LIEIASQNVMLDARQMPKENGMHTMAKQERPVKHRHLPIAPPRERIKISDHHPQQTEIDKVQHDHTDKTHQKICAILHARANRDSDKF
jgi:hypothetical protein